MKLNIAILAACATLAFVTNAKADEMPLGCVEPEAYFDAMEYSDGAESLGIFGKITGMKFEGELVKMNGVIYDVRFYGNSICVNEAEPHTKYNLIEKW